MKVGIILLHGWTLQRDSNAGRFLPFGLVLGADELPVGTYFYLLDLNDGSPIFKGTIYLTR